MNAERYFLLSALLPIAVPLLTVGPILLAEHLLETRLVLPQALDAIKVTLVFSLFIAGLRHTLFAGAFLLLLRGRSTQAYVRAAIIAPPAFAVFNILYQSLVSAPSVVVGLTDLRMLYENLRNLGALMVTIGLPLGYAYVALSLGGYWALRRAGVISLAHGPRAT